MAATLVEENSATVVEAFLRETEIFGELKGFANKTKAGKDVEKRHCMNFWWRTSVFRWHGSKRWPSNRRCLGSRSQAPGWIGFYTDLRGHHWCAEECGRVEGKPEVQTTCIGNDKSRHFKCCVLNISKLDVLIATITHYIGACEMYNMSSVGETR